MLSGTSPAYRPTQNAIHSLPACSSLITPRQLATPVTSNPKHAEISPTNLKIIIKVN